MLRRWTRRAAQHPPRGPFRTGFWRSPLRGPWFTAVLSVALLPGITLMFLTGLASYAAYNPNLAPGNNPTPDKGLLRSWLPGWPTVRQPHHHRRLGHRGLVESVRERTRPHTDSIEEPCIPKVNRKSPAVDQGISTNPARDR